MLFYVILAPQKICSRFDDLTKDDLGFVSILHLDCRPSNVLAKKGRVKAVIDWSNAVVGHPGMDIARISENGLLSEEFMKGYRWSEVYKRYDGELQKVFELEANVFISIVYMTVLRKPEEAHHFIKRVKTLLEILAS